MPFFTVNYNPETTPLARIQAARALLPVVISEAVRMAMVDAVEALRETWSQAKRSDSDGSGDPPPGDAPGPLDNSWVATTESSGATATGIVVTSQPTKLRYIRAGTGVYGPSGQPIVPRAKRALYWEGAAYPVRSVRGSPPNDFIPAARQLARQLALARVQAAADELARTLNGR